MSILNDLFGKIFGGNHPAQPPSGPVATGPAQPNQSNQSTGAAPVDVEAVLMSYAAKHKEKLDWKHSIVDLLKVVDMDSSMEARKHLADELHYTGDTHDSAAMNMWLHKEIVKKLASNGGKIPQELLS